MLEQLVDSWQINHRVTLRLLEALSDDALKATLSTRGGRDVARQLAHVHEVRADYAEVTSKTNRSAKLPCGLSKTDGRGYSWPPTLPRGAWTSILCRT